VFRIARILLTTLAEY